MLSEQPARLLSWAVSAVLLVALLSIFALVVRPFVQPFVWSVIVVLMTWPLYQGIRARVNLSETVGALLMTSILAAGFALAVVPLALQLAREARATVGGVKFSFGDLREAAADVPIIGERLAELVGKLLARDAEVLGEAFAMREPVVRVMFDAAQGLVESLFTLTLAVFISFFLFRHGRSIYEQVRLVLYQIGGRPLLRLFRTAEHTVRGTVYGAIVTALAQGLLAGIGFFFAGAPVPALLGFATMLLSFIPFGAPFVYLPVSLYLAFVVGPWYAGIGLLIWGVLVVSMADNILRPLFISHTTRMSVLLVFVGVFGGVLSFGLLGIILGPTIIAVAQSLWFDFVRLAASSPGANERD